MSWFTDIAGKAEDLLNRVDQTAATALQHKTKHASYENSPSHIRQQYSEIASQSSYSPSRTYSKIPTPSLMEDHKTSLPSLNSAPDRKYGQPSKLNPESDDEKLLQFLNSSETLPKKSKAVSPVKKLMQGSDIEQQIENKKEASELPFTESKSVAHSASVVSPVNLLEESCNEEALEIQQTEAISASQQSSEIFVVKDSLVNNEVTVSENQKKSAEPEVKSTQKKLDYRNSQMSSGDKVIRELREREKDMIAAMDAKDSQLAILKVRLQEADQELQAKWSVGRDLEVENDRMIKEHAQKAAFQNKTLEVLQEQLQQKENELNKIKESALQKQNEHMQKFGKMEEEQRHLAESYSVMQKRWTDLNDKSKELSVQLKQSSGNLEALQQEYDDYKQKAHRILQSKEKLISSLKGGHLEVDSVERSEAASMLLNAEIESVKQERDLIRDELRRANELVETYRSEVQELEKVSQNDSLTSQERQKLLKEQLEVEKSQKEEMQLLNVQFKEELQLLREDLTRTKNGFQTRIQDREIEIDKLRRQLTAKSLSTVSQDELESRLHALTENLIQKQTLVEALSTEKNSLVLQLERLEQQLREAQNYGLQQHTFVGINNNESERKSKQVFLENPFDSALTRRAKKVYGTIDSFSVRLGVFFRRYPIARVFIIIYMLLLHFWVMIVLLTYEPEVHNSNYEFTKVQQ